MMKEKDIIKNLFQEARRSDSHLFFAPGRVNLIGDHTDYSGGFVLPAAIQFGTYLLVRLKDGNKIDFSSWNFTEKRSVSIDNIHNRTNTWIDYPLGVIVQLLGKGLQLQGMELHYFGDIPNGAGLSSSASIEMVTAYALNTLFQLQISLVDLALLSQKAENEFIGVSSGIMDQFAVGLGEPGKAIFLNCHNLIYQLVHADFGEYRLMVVNSNKKRTLAGSKYNERVGELNEILKILNQTETVSYLGKLNQRDFLVFQSKVKNETLLKRLRHVVSENARVQEAVNLLKSNNLIQFGKYMFQSHLSLANDYEVSCNELDTLFKIAESTEGVIGSRMTGAGFGGCTVNLVQKDSIEIFKKRIEDEYSQSCGLKADVFEIQINSQIKEIFPG